MSPAGALLAAALAAAAPPAAFVICDDVFEPASLDPERAFDNKSDGILNQVYEGLARIDSSGALAPALAQSWERVDPLTLRFELRAARFHDGAPVTAQDARDSLLRQLDSGSPASMQIASIAEVVAESSSTLVVRSRQPDGLLLRRLAAFARVAKAGAGTGPYRLGAREPGKWLELERFDGYWGQAPARERVRFVFLPEEEQLAALEAGKVDLLTDLPGTMTRRVAERPDLELRKAATLAMHAFWFTSFKGALSDRRVRRALNHALDRAELIRYAARGNGRPLATFSMPGEAGHDPALLPYAHDEKKARALLKEAGLAKGLSLRGLVISQSEREARVIAAQLKKVGVTLELEVVPIAEAFRIVGAGKNRDYDFFANLAPDPVAHASFLAGVCLHSASPMSAGGYPGFDERYGAILGAPDAEAQEKAARALDSFIHEEALGLFTYQRIKTFAARAGAGVTPPLSGMLDLRELGGR